jgi:hypothetical protein
MVLGSPRRVVKNKYLVFLGTVADMHQVLIVNTRPAPFIQASPDLMADQVPLDKKAHPFLDHDSYVACHELHDVSVREVGNALVANMDDIKTMLSDAVRAQVVQVVQDSKNLIPLHQKFIAEALKP